MALWSTEHEHYADAVLADCVPSTIPLCKFRNTSGPTEGSCKVRDLAYNSHNVVNCYLCELSDILLHEIISIWLHYKLVRVLLLFISGTATLFSR